MNYMCHIRILLCVIIATMLALTSHIYISDWAKPLIVEMTQGLKPDTINYPNSIMLAAYGTALITVALLVFLYYHTNHLVPVKSKLLKVIILAAIILEIKGDLFRQTIMDLLLNYQLGMPNPVKFVVINQLDKWVANLLLAFSLVYLCPGKGEAKESLS